MYLLTIQLIRQDRFKRSFWNPTAGCWAPKKFQLQSLPCKNASWIKQNKFNTIQLIDVEYIKKWMHMDAHLFSSSKSSKLYVGNALKLFTFVAFKVYYTKKHASPHHL